VVDDQVGQLASHQLEARPQLRLASWTSNADPDCRIVLRSKAAIAMTIVLEAGSIRVDVNAVSWTT